MKYERPTWDEFFLQIATAAAARSNCGKNKYRPAAHGAVLTDGTNHILGIGYNGTPASYPNCSDSNSPGGACGGADDRRGDYSKCVAIHAEINCITYAHSISLAKKLYITRQPCFNCAKVIANTPIIEIITYEDGETDSRVLELFNRVDKWLNVYRRGTKN
jgi:dCMP deaminase